MAQLIVRHKVKNYKKWKSIFDSSRTIRKIYGEINYQIFRNTEEPNNLSIIFEWESPQKVIKYAQTQELRNVMKLSGVIDEPEIFILDGVLAD